MSALLLVALPIIWIGWRETFRDPASLAFLALYITCALGIDITFAIRGRR